MGLSLTLPTIDTTIANHAGKTVLLWWKLAARRVQNLVYIAERLPWRAPKIHTRYAKPAHLSASAELSWNEKGIGESETSGVVSIKSTETHQDGSANSASD